MPQPPMSEKIMREAVEAVALHGSVKKAAEALGLSRTTLDTRYQKAKNAGFCETPETAITAPQFPDDDIGVPEIIDLMAKRSAKVIENYRAKKWMPFKVNSMQPVGIAFVGDPHMDDNGCNWTLLKRDIGILSRTEGMHAVLAGDLHNNWVGRLQALYADQDTSKNTAWRLIEHFLKDSGIDWLLALLGNHDSWNDGGRMITELCKNVCPVVDWRAQFKLVFPNKRECLIDAAHNFKGHSMWNILHSLQRAAKQGGVAHIYLAGDHHVWGLAQHECEETGRIYSLARARGYKFVDSFAHRHQFGSQANGATIVAIVNPQAKNDVSFVKCFADLEDGAEYLKYLRKIYK